MCETHVPLRSLKKAAEPKQKNTPVTAPTPLTVTTHSKNTAPATSETLQSNQRLKKNIPFTNLLTIPDIGPI